MSVTPHSGLLGVSSQTSFVAPGLTAPRKRRKILGVDEIDAEPEGRRFAGEPGAQTPNT